MRGAFGVLMIVALALVGCTSGDAPPPGRLIKGKIESTSEGEAVAPSALGIAPQQGATAEPAVEDALRASLSLRGVAVEPGAPFVLRYRYVGVPITLDDPGIGIGVGGVFGSSGTQDVGVGLELPVFFDYAGDSGTAFRLDLSLERPDGRRLWRARADGLARPIDPYAIVRPVVPLLLNRLGETTPAQSFTR
jgi:hypothetical protein